MTARSTEDPIPLLHIRLFGPPRVHVRGVPIPGLRSYKGTWLLALLVLRAGAKVERDWLAALLWPESAQRQARANLRNSLKDLRRAFGAEAGRLSSPTLHTLTLDLAGSDVDVVAFDQAIARGDEASLEQATALYRGPLLEGCAEDWAFAERQPREQACLQALETLAERALAVGDAARAERYLRRMIAVDRLRESAYRKLMGVLAASGNFGRALVAYQELRQHLRAEIHTEPDPETQALFGELSARAHRRATIATAVAAPGAGQRDTSNSGLPAGFPTLGTVALRPQNLPAQVTPLIGREGEVAAVQQLLRRETTRLVTLTGPGGIGKTRVGLQVAAELLDASVHGVFFIDLAPVTDPERVVSTIAQALGVRETGSQPLVERLKEYLRAKQILLLLDNFEQVLPASLLVSELLASCPRLKALVTSRAILHLRGEHEFPIGSLGLPDRKRMGSEKTELAVALSRYAAVELFIQRAVAARPDFALTSQTAFAVAQICVRLDGLPLAIELVAARIRQFTPHALLAALDRHLILSTDGPLDLPARQQTLRSAIGWSYDLLDQAEQSLFRRLAVFVGGCAPEAAQAVCGSDEAGSGEVREGLARLIHQNLLRQETAAHSQPRYTMLATIHEFSQERLEESPEREAVRRRHAAFFSRFAEQSVPAAIGLEAGTDAGGWLDPLEQELGNLRAALEWALESGSAEIGLPLGDALARFWSLRGAAAEGQRPLARLLSLPAAAERTVARARALLGAAAVAWVSGDLNASRALGEESLAIGREQDDSEIISRSLLRLAIVVRQEGDYPLTRSLLEESLAMARCAGNAAGIADALLELAPLAIGEGDLQRAHDLLAECLHRYREVGRQGGVAWAVWRDGHVLRYRGELAAAEARYHESLRIFREQDQKFGMISALIWLANTARLRSDWEAASSHLEEALAFNREIGRRDAIAGTLSDLGMIAYRCGYPEAARRNYQEALALWETLSDPATVARCLTELAEATGARGHPEISVLLHAAAAGVLEDSGLSSAPHTEAASRTDAIRAVLGQDRFASLWQDGRAMPAELAIERALRWPDPLP